MPNTPDYAWPPMDKRKVMGTSPKRLDGPQKASGRAKYNSDVKPQGLVFGVYLTCPHAHAKVTSIDTSAAEKSQGVTAVHVVATPGTELQWQYAEVAAVAATTEELARDAVRKIKVEYEVMPHLVSEEDLSKAGPRAKAAGEQVTGDVEKAFQEAEVTSEASYGMPVITHCCLEPHGQTLQWKGDSVEYWPSTQNISGIGSTLAPNIKVEASKIHAHMDYVGGGFGSKFAADAWGVACANLSQKSGGKPVKLFLDRAHELSVAGNRPSAFGKIKIGAKKDGTITVWESQTWATGGMAGGGMPPVPYVFVNIPNRRMNHTAVAVNGGPQRAWRAPNNQQACFLTCSAIEDLAAKLNMDPVEVLYKNAEYSARAEVYRAQLRKAQELIDWKKNWHARGDSGSGPMKRGLGVALHTWGGGGHNSKCRTVINADGSVAVELGSQDLGTGTKTIIVQVAAETLGLPMSAVKLNVGDSNLPPSGGSGGSTTVGGVSSSTRKAAVNALAKLFETVAPSLVAPPDQLEAVDSHIRVKGNPSKSITWAAACKKLGATKISEEGENQQRNPMGLNSSGVGGVQMADVSVDTETGIVKMNKFVAVQDIGLVINPELAKSQIYGAVIMGICSALMEERIMDEQTGHVLNPDMEFYKLAGIGDIGEIMVHLDITETHDKRGVVGLGEPPAVSPLTAIGNAVANAIGVRVPRIPLSPDRVLAALERRHA
jgi:xanthine dehydrogenase YagR molybdenum-binding subunit